MEYFHTDWAAMTANDWQGVIITVLAVVAIFGAVGVLALLLARLHAADIADILEGLPLDERKRVWDVVRAERGGVVLLEAGEVVRSWLIESLQQDELAQLLAQLDAEDLAHVRLGQFEQRGHRLWIERLIRRCDGKKCFGLV